MRLEMPHGADVASWIGLDLCCHPSRTAQTWQQGERFGSMVRQLVAAVRGSVLSPPLSWKRTVCCHNPVCDVMADYCSMGGACHTHELRAGAAGDVTVSQAAVCHSRDIDHSVLIGSTSVFRRYLKAVGRFEFCCCKNETTEGIFVQVRSTMNKSLGGCCAFFHAFERIFLLCLQDANYIRHTQSGCLGRFCLGQQNMVEVVSKVC